MTSAPVPAAGEIALHRVGTAGEMAADSAFGVALVTLWHRVSQADGAVGFLPDVSRGEVAGRAAPMVEEVRRGHAHAVAATLDRRLVGFVALTPGRWQTDRHVGTVAQLMVDPDRQGAGLGRRLLTEVIALAGDLGLEQLDLSVRGGCGLEAFYEKAGFAVWGVRPGRLRVAPGDDRDEVWLSRTL